MLLILSPTLGQQMQQTRQMQKNADTRRVIKNCHHSLKKAQAKLEEAKGRGKKKLEFSNYLEDPPSTPKSWKILLLFFYLIKLEKSESPTP